ncbi:MAG: cytidine deaminase [Syntrophomonadaceae bacterium]|nr:cytidine deaminase [Syntrophomonadaceae bacterium]
MNEAGLIEYARAVRNHAYAPYSGFKVGAAILGRSGRVYTGCNVENASYGLTICAERAAAARAISDGEREFVCLALVGSGEGFTYPCGACLQVLAEFAPRLNIITVNKAGQTRKNLLEELLPQVFALNREEFNGG